MAKNKTETPKKKHRKLKRILLSILGTIVGLFLIVTAISYIGLAANINKVRQFPRAGTPELLLDNYSDGCWNITSDKGLKVVQLTDVHIGGGFLSIQKDMMAANAVAAMVSAEKPDLVVVTGDVAYPVPFQAGTLNNKNGARLFAELMEKLGVYWTICYGNHDTEIYSYFSREQITEFYTSGRYPHCLLQSGPAEVDGVGNQVFNVVNSDGVVTRSLFMVDSHSYIDGDYFGINWKYDNIHENQIKWYSDTVKQLNEQNKNAVAALDADKQAEYKDLAEIVPSTAFFHIPLGEYKTAWNEYVENGSKDTADTKYNYGVAGESGKIVYCGIHEDNVFETMKALGSTDTVFCGHDHKNNFSLNYKGINLTYGMSIDYLAYPGIYKLGSQRGCTVIQIGKDGSIDYSSQNYYQDKYNSFYAKEAVTMQ